MPDGPENTPSPIQLYRSALRFLYLTTLKRSWFEEDVAGIKHRPKLPTVLSAEEVTRILDRTTNLRHWTIFATLYATGLRCNELRHLKVQDRQEGFASARRSAIGIWQCWQPIPRASDRIATVVNPGFWRSAIARRNSQPLVNRVQNQFFG